MAKSSNQALNSKKRVAGTQAVPPKLEVVATMAAVPSPDIVDHSVASNKEDAANQLVINSFHKAETPDKPTILADFNSGETPDFATQIFDVRRLTIDKVEPEEPLEHQEITVFFTLTNWSLKTVNGFVRPRYGNGEKKITLEPNKSKSGKVTALAPAAGNGAVPVELLFWREVITDGEVSDPPDLILDKEQYIDATATFMVNVAAEYSFSLDQMQIDVVRSRWDDTDFVGLLVSVDGQVIPDEENLVGDLADPTAPAKPSPIHWLRKGDVDENVHQLGLSVGKFRVLPSTNISIMYMILNKGHNLEGIEKFLNLISAGAKEQLENWYKGTNWGAAHDFTMYLNGLLFADCDGIVALDYINTAGNSMNVWTAVGGLFRNRENYPGTHIGPDQIKLYEARDGCGLTMSSYWVTYSFLRHSYKPSNQF